MNNIKTTAEDILAAIIAKIRDTLTPIFNKYTIYYKYIEFFIYGVYALLLLGIYNTVPQYIPTLRNTILYTAVVILLLRFNSISWSNPKFAILGGNTFSEFDRRLIMSTCLFILVTHIVSEAALEYAKRQLQNKIIVPVGIVSEKVLHPIYHQGYRQA
ncbi:hypothetical protein EBV26_16730 [bacterium]|nr:hypothetical protein [bacterium]